MAAPVALPAAASSTPAVVAGAHAAAWLTPSCGGAARGPLPLGGCITGMQHAPHAHCAHHAKQSSTCNGSSRRPAHSPRGPFTRTLRALTSMDTSSGMTRVREEMSCRMVAAGGQAGKGRQRWWVGRGRRHRRWRGWPAAPRSVARPECPTVLQRRVVRGAARRLQPAAAGHGRPPPPPRAAAAGPAVNAQLPAAARGAGPQRQPCCTPRWCTGGPGRHSPLCQPSPQLPRGRGRRGRAPWAPRAALGPASAATPVHAALDWTCAGRAALNLHNWRCRGMHRRGSAPPLSHCLPAPPPPLSATAFNLRPTPAGQPLPPLVPGNCYASRNATQENWVELVGQNGSRAPAGAHGDPEWAGTKQVVRQVPSTSRRDGYNRCSCLD